MGELYSITAVPSPDRNVKSMKVLYSMPAFVQVLIAFYIAPMMLSAQSSVSP